MGQLTILRNTKIAIVEETTEGTLATELASSALAFREDGISVNIGRELLEEGFITGSLSETAPRAGMWADDLGWTLPTYARGKGTLTTKPDFSTALKSLMGSEAINTDDTVAASPTPKPTIFTVTGHDFTLGQLILVDSEPTRIVGISSDEITVWPPLSAAPSASDSVEVGINWMLASTGHPTFSSYLYFDGSKRLALAGCRTNSLEINFEVGQQCKMEFGIVSLVPTTDYTAQAVTPVLDTVTQPPICLGMELKVYYAGTTSGTPTTTSTILAAPNFDVAIDDLIFIDTGSITWEQATVSAVSGNPGSNITLTHSAVTTAASGGVTVYIARKKCAGIGDTLSISVELETEFQKCMQASSGKSGSIPTGRKVTLSKSPYFMSWQEILIRNEVIGSELMILLGDTADNKFCTYMPNIINTEVSLEMENFMRVGVSSQAVVDSTLGNDHELVMATF